jgi:hypothetical protein
MVVGQQEEFEVPTLLAAQVRIVGAEVGHHGAAGARHLHPETFVLDHDTIMSVPHGEAFEFAAGRVVLSLQRNGHRCLEEPPSPWSGT